MHGFTSLSCPGEQFSKLGRVFTRIAVALGLSRIHSKVPRLNHAVRAFQFSKQEVERILSTATDKLTRRELSVRAASCKRAEA
jgi:hypothetical protein